MFLAPVNEVWSKEIFSEACAFSPQYWVTPCLAYSFRVASEGYLSAGFSVRGFFLSKGSQFRGSLSRDLCFGGLCLGVTVQESLSKGVSLSQCLCLGHYSRRYASYWNAFLFFISWQHMDVFSLKCRYLLKNHLQYNICINHYLSVQRYLGRLLKTVWDPNHDKNIFSYSLCSSFPCSSYSSSHSFKPKREEDLI